MRLALPCLLTTLAVSTSVAAQPSPAPVGARLAAADTARRPPGRSLIALHDKDYPRWEEETAHFVDRTMSAALFGAPVAGMAALSYQWSERGGSWVPFAAVAVTSVGVGAALPRGHSECGFLKRVAFGGLGALAGAGLATLASGKRVPDDMGAEPYSGAVLGAALAHPRCGGRY